MLENIPNSSQFKSRSGEGGIIGHRKEDKLDTGGGLPQLLGSIQTIYQGHTDIQHDDVGHQFGREIQQLSTVLHDSNYLAAIFKQRTKPFGHDAVIVSQENTRARLIAF